MFCENGYYVGPRTILVPRTVKPKPVDIFLSETVDRNGRVDGMKLKVHRRIGVLWTGFL